MHAPTAAEDRGSGGHAARSAGRKGADSRVALHAGERDTRSKAAQDDGATSRSTTARSSTLARRLVAMVLCPMRECENGKMWLRHTCAGYLAP